jgi:NADPH2:quinone reductase
MMRAWAIDSYGAPMRLQDLPMPQAGPDDVVIRMRGAEVGDWDELVRTGEWPMERPFPLVMGLAGSGIADGVGANVAGIAVANPVYAYSYPLYDNGAWAEYMRVPARYAAHAPASLDLARAGAVPIVALTAHETLLDVLNVTRGEVVLITAASGGVGHLAVQIAAQAGARVIATASARNRDFVAGLGAELVIDYTSEDVVGAIRARHPHGIPKALNGVSGEAANALVEVMSDGGHIVDLPGTISASRPDVRIDTDYVVRGDGTRLARISRLIDDGRLRVHFHDILAFEQAPRALGLVLAKHVRGKVGLRIA